MRDDGHTPLIDRERDPKSRVHEDLTDAARERLAVITDNIGVDNRVEAVQYLIKRVGKTPFEEYVNRFDYGGIERVHHEEFILSSKTKYILTYIEFLVKSQHELDVRSRWVKGQKSQLGKSLEDYDPSESLAEAIDDIENVLVTEGILWDIDRLGKGGVIEFRPLGSKGLGELDDELRAIGQNQPWGEALKGYDAAFERYRNGKFDEQIPKKLYNSVEEVLQTICVDEEGWADNRNLPHSDYLELLKEEGVYEAHGVTSVEVKELLDSLERMVAKISDDRKQPHAYHDRAYCTLLIHQVGAYLYFLINRYEDYSS